jgi:hypothetical protein
VLLISKHSYFGASFATVVTETFGLALALFFLRRYGDPLGSKRASMRLFRHSYRWVVSALLLFENANDADNIIDLDVYAVVIYKFGINDDD